MSQHSPVDTADTRLSALLFDCAAAFETHGSAAGSELASALRVATGNGARLPPATAPGCELLPRALERRRGEPAVLARVREAHSLLAWRSPVAIRELGALDGQLAVVVLLGPDGMFHCGHAMTGLFWQKPHVDYPGHCHEADEIYLILSGRAEWGLESHTPVQRDPGEFVHHLSWQSHSMCTGTEPLLALWGWTGNISLDTYRMTENC